LGCVVGSSITRSLCGGAWTSARQDNLGERLLDANRTIGQPDKIGRKITKQYRGKLQTEIEDMNLPTPVIRSHYGNGVGAGDWHDNRAELPCTESANGYQKLAWPLPLAFERLVSNEGRVASPVKAVSRMRGPAMNMNPEWHEVNDLEMAIFSRWKLDAFGTCRPHTEAAGSVHWLVPPSDRAPPAQTRPWTIWRPC
jgi:hypothetical protein